MEDHETVTPVDTNTGNNQVEILTVEELSTLVGRPVKDIEDFKKHYQNLKSYTAEVPKVKVVEAWMKDAGIEDLTKVNPYKIGEIVKSLSPGTDIGPNSMVVNERIEKIEGLAKKVLRNNNTSDKEDLVREMLLKK